MPKGMGYPIMPKKESKGSMAKMAKKRMEKKSC